MTQIAIIGITGAGKTVFSTVWAKRMEKRDNPELGYIELDGAETEVYVRDAYATLTSGTWCDPTDKEKKTELRFILHIYGTQLPVKLIDAAGQDLASLFRLDLDADVVIDGELKKYVEEAAILLLIVNLRDFFGEPDAKKLWRNASIYAKAIDAVRKTKRKQKIALIWTAYDRYKSHIDKWKGIERYLSEGEDGHLELLHNAITDAKQAGCVVKSFMVAPVEAEESFENISTTGISGTQDGPDVIPNPKKGFMSPGLKKVSAWIAKMVREQIEQEAKGGNKEALCAWGRIIYYGYDLVEKDKKKAFEIFERVHKDNPEYPYVKLCLALCHYHGKGVVGPNRIEALKLIREASNFGSKKANDFLNKLFSKEELQKSAVDDLTELLMKAQSEIIELTEAIKQLEYGKQLLDIQLMQKTNDVNEVNKQLDECKYQWYKFYESVRNWVWRKAALDKIFESTVDKEYHPPKSSGTS